MAAYEIQNILENIDPLVVLGGLSFLGGLATLYRTVTSFNQDPGMTTSPVMGPDPTGGPTPIQLQDVDGNPVFRPEHPYNRGLAARNQGLRFYAGLVASVALLLTSGFAFGEAFADTGYL